MERYRKMTAEMADRLKDVVGEQDVLVQGDEVALYACDEMAVPRPGLPEVVVKPGTTRAVAEVLRLAAGWRVPVTPRGGGTGLSGGAVPRYGGILLSMEKMGRVKEVDRDNFVAVVEAGVPLSTLYEEVESHGLSYPLYPGDRSAYVGGTVATNAGGMKAVRYGTTRDFVRGLEAVLPGGEVIHSGGKVVKCSTGYDLTRLLVGSEGTLAVITEVALRLTVAPRFRDVLLAPFPDLQRAIAAVPELLRRRVPVAGLEFLEQDAVALMEEAGRGEMPFRQHHSFLLVLIEGDSSEEVYRAAGLTGEVCSENGAIDIYVAGSEHARRALLDARSNMYHALKRTGPTDIADVVVPPSRIADFVAEVKRISARHQVPVLAYGHAGDGNVHLHPMGKGMSADEWSARLPLVMKEMYQAGVALGGTISGEHGLGSEKSAYLPLAAGSAEIALMKRIKQAFDPGNIMNPGKVF